MLEIRNIHTDSYPDDQTLAQGENLVEQTVKANTPSISGIRERRMGRKLGLYRTLRLETLHSSRISLNAVIQQLRDYADESHVLTVCISLWKNYEQNLIKRTTI